MLKEIFTQRSTFQREHCAWQNFKNSIIKTYRMSHHGHTRNLLIYVKLKALKFLLTQWTSDIIQLTETILTIEIRL